MCKLQIVAIFCDESDIYVIGLLILSVWSVGSEMLCCGWSINDAACCQSKLPGTAETQ